KGVAPFARANPGPGEEQGGVHRVVVEILLAEQAVTADGEAVIAAKDDQGILVLAACSERIEDAANLGVEEGDGGVIIGEVLANDIRRSRPRGQTFVASGQIAVIERVLWQVIGRQ